MYLSLGRGVRSGGFPSGELFRVDMEDGAYMMALYEAYSGYKWLGTPTVLYVRRPGTLHELVDIPPQSMKQYQDARVACPSSHLHLSWRWLGKKDSRADFPVK
jgi:hypothetical protein